MASQGLPISATFSLIPRGLGLALLFPNCSLLRAARLEHHGPLVGVPLSLCFRYRRSPVIVTGTSFGCWLGVLASAHWSPWNPSCEVIQGLQESFQSHRRDCIILSRCYPAINFCIGGERGRTRGTHNRTSSSPFITHGASNGRMHLGST